MTSSTVALRAYSRSVRIALVLKRTPLATRRGALCKRTPVCSERHSELRSKCDGVRRGRVHWPAETHWQVCLDEVSFESKPGRSNRSGLGDSIAAAERSGPPAHECGVVQKG